MDLRPVLLPQAGPSTGQNTSTDQHRRASIRLSRAQLATQSAPRFDLVLMAAGVFVEQVEGLVVAEVNGCEMERPGPEAAKQPLSR
jgi:hypothetical protein